jgi:hypothetical protein
MTDVGAPAPEVYRLSMEKLPAAVGRARRLTLVQVLAVVTALVTAISAVFRGPGGTDASLVVWGLGVVILPYVLWQARVRVRRRWNAFELSIGPTNMRCAARGSGRVTLALDEIGSITEGASGLVVRSSQSDAVIRIPRTVEGFVDVRRRLGGRRPITARADALVWCGALLGAGFLAAATVPVWGRAGCVAAGIVACQAAAAFAAAVEVRWHPRLGPSLKLAAYAALAGAAALPVIALAAEELARALPG